MVRDLNLHFNAIAFQYLNRWVVNCNFVTYYHKGKMWKIRHKKLPATFTWVLFRTWSLGKEIHRKSFLCCWYQTGTVGSKRVCESTIKTNFHYVVLLISSFYHEKKMLQIKTLDPNLQSLFIVQPTDMTCYINVLPRQIGINMSACLCIICITLQGYKLQWTI